MFIPGRHPGFDDFAVSSFGAVIGAVLTVFYLEYFRRSARDQL